MQLASFSVRHARAIVFLTAVLTLFGVWAYVRTPAAIFPEMRFSRISVVAQAGNLPPEQARTILALPLEREFLGLPSVRRVLTTSELGNTDTTVEFDPATDARSDLQYVESAIARARPDLPVSATVEANVLTPQTEPVLSWVLTSSTLSQTLLREYAQRAILPALYGTPGLARAIVVGGPEREYHVDLDPSSLATARISAQDVVAALSAANSVSAAGVAEAYSQRTAVLVDGGLHDASDLARVAVPTRDASSLPVSALGSVGLGVAPATDQVSTGSVHGIGLNAYALPGSDNVRMAAALKERLRTIQTQLPQGTQLHLYWDSTDLIVASQAELTRRYLCRCATRARRHFLLFRNLRMTLVAAIIIPAAMSIAVLAISLFGETLNIMSVGGLAIAVGLIIDDAIVVVEGIAGVGRCRCRLVAFVAADDRIDAGNRRRLPSARPARRRLRIVFSRAGAHALLRAVRLARSRAFLYAARLSLAPVPAKRTPHRATGYPIATSRSCGGPRSSPRDVRHRDGRIGGDHGVDRNVAERFSSKAGRGAVRNRVCHAGRHDTGRQRRRRDRDRTNGAGGSGRFGVGPDRVSIRTVSRRRRCDLESFV